MKKLKIFRKILAGAIVTMMLFAAVIAVTSRDIVKTPPLIWDEKEAPVLWSPNTFEMDFSYTFSEPEITEYDIDGVIYHRVTMDDLPVSSEIGCPVLPVKPINVLLPQAYKFHRIEVNWEGYVSLGENFNVELGMEPTIPGWQDIPDVVSDFDTSVPYPSELYVNVGVNDLRGYNILTFNLHPVYYIGETGELYYYEVMDVTVITTDEGEISPFFRGLPEDAMLIEDNGDILDTYDMVSTYDELPANTRGRSGIVDPFESYDYVIITNEALKNAQGDYTFQTLRDFKNSRGTPTTIVTVEDIYDAYDGVDNLEKIRNFIKDAYSYWGWRTKYVLLGGDNDIIPARRFAWLIYEPGEEVDQPVPSDLYYACLNGNFNYDGDEHFGEIGDLNDYRAEVYIGRACVNTEEELSTFVEKTISYTTSEDSYLNKVTMVGEFLFESTSIIIDGEEVILPALYGGDYMDQLIDVSWATGYRTFGIPSDTYTIDKLYDRDWPGFDPENQYETGWPKSEITDRINNNVHIINHLGHGNNYHCMKLDEPIIMRGAEFYGECHDVMDNITNDKHFFLYTQACLAGAFDNKTIRGMWNDTLDPEFDVPYDCIAEYLTVKTNHGAFAVIANTRYGLAAPNLSGIEPWGPSHHFNREFWDAVFGEGQHYRKLKELGAANQDSKEDNIFRLVNPANICVFFELTVFGDPQIAIKDPEDYDSGWVSPTGYNDLQDAWHYEPLSYDRDVNTNAGCTISDTGWRWTPWLELTLDSEIEFTKIKFYAWYNALHCREVDIDYTHNGETWYCFYDPVWEAYMDTYIYPDREWYELFAKSDGSSEQITKVRVRFLVKRWILNPVTADLHELQIYQVGE